MKYLASLLAAVLLASTFLVRSVLADGLADVAISNVTDTSFVVSWITAEPEMGQVQIIEGATYDDVRGVDFRGTTHYVTVAGLQPDRPYRFNITSGGIGYDNAESDWVAETGTTLSPRHPDVISGLVNNPDGTLAADAIVFTMIDRVQQGAPSAILSALVTPGDAGIFSVNLAETRALGDPTRYFDYAVGSDRYMNNSVTLEAMSAAGTGLVTMEIADPGLRSVDRERMLAIPLTADKATP